MTVFPTIKKAEFLENSTGISIKYFAELQSCDLIRPCDFFIAYFFQNTIFIEIFFIIIV